MPTRYLSQEEIARYVPCRPSVDGLTSLERARRSMIATGQWSEAQAMGRRWAIGCVALEITQRCNLDCTLCYLSENAEAVRDMPLTELYRRIDTILDLYGPNTDIQITGGDPTLRRRDELVAIVRRIRDRAMRPSLFTNGIRATRELLTELAAVGLVDVAFHVDMTQQRRGYRSEAELNSLRRDYIERARGLNLAVIFNTTVSAGNLPQIPDVVAFLAMHSDVVTFASFQVQAETGRGVETSRPKNLTADTVADAICRGIGTKLSFGFPAAGHARCNRHAMALVCNGRAYDFYDDRQFFLRVLGATANLTFDRQNRRSALWTAICWTFRHPWVILPGMRWLGRKLWRMRRDLVAARGRVTKLSLFIHSFMDARCLESDRIDACAFMVVTPNGPISMCLYNACRDDFVLQPIRVAADEGDIYWDPLTGKLRPGSIPGAVPTLPRSRLKGRAKLTSRRAG